MKKPTTLRIFATTVVIMVTAVTIIGLFIAGSPGQEREYKMDEQRTEDLMQIASSVDLYYERYGSLPADLDALTDESQTRNYYMRSITDPVTGEPYGYSAKNDTVYELCAEFSLASRENEEYYYPRPVAPSFEEAWEHESGLHCFELDAELRTLRNFCSLRKPCMAGQSCVTLPGMDESVCVPEGQECAAAKCPVAGECAVDREMYPMGVFCIDPVTGEPIENMGIEDVLEEPME